MSRVVVVGASVAGVRAVETLRKRGFDGALTLIGAEAEIPYNPTPLSKELLTGDLSESDLQLVTRQRLDELAVEVRLGCRATALDPSARRVRAGGDSLPFDGLILATGSTPKRLPEPLRLRPGAYTLRTLDDGRKLRALLQARPQVVIVGGGFIGAEVAASARTLGLDVTIVHSGPAVMSTHLPLEIARSCERLHREHGTEVRCGVPAVRFHGSEWIEAVALADGTVVPADLVVVATGAEPNVGWLASSGLQVTRQGLLCDAHLHAGAPGVYAAGDIVRWPHPELGLVRVEHWTNAVEQAKRAAGNLLEPDAATAQVTAPYVWSDQYGWRLQIVGDPNAAAPLIVSGSLDSASFLALVPDAAGRRLAGAIAMDAPERLPQARTMIARGATWQDACSQEWTIA